MILVIGEILFDVFPSYRRIGGAPFNFAFHLKKLGCAVGFISRVGRDDQGEEIARFLSRHGFDGKDLQVDAAAPTGRVNVLPDHGGGHRFEIIENRAFDFIEYTPRLEKLLENFPELICFGTLAQRSPEGASLMARVMEAKNEKTKAFCDLNLRENCYSQETIGASLQWSDRLKLSREELFTLFPGKAESTATELVRSLMADYHLETVILTRGADGSEWFSPHTSHQIRPSRRLSVMDTVGAGDAFAAMAVACMSKKIAAAKAITLAHDFASSICTIKGALPANDDFYRDYRKTMGGI
ncbi:MAG: PfkB family carbohydrate kinase [Desulfobacteraceae bacterium]